MQLLRAATAALPAVYKAHKWLVTRGDLDYTALWILYAATSLAQIEVIGAGMVADREVIPQAMKLNPALFETIYIGLLNAKKTQGQRRVGARAGRRVPRRRARPRSSRPSSTYLREVGEARSCTEIENHFKRHFDVSRRDDGVRVPGRSGTDRQGVAPARLTKKSNVDRAGAGVLHLR